MPAEGYSVSTKSQSLLYTIYLKTVTLQETTRKSNRKPPAFFKIEEISFNMYLHNSVDKDQ